MKNIGTSLLVLSSVLLLSSTVLTAINKDNEIEKLKKASVGTETAENKNISDETNDEESDNKEDTNTEENTENNENVENVENAENAENTEENVEIATPTVNELDNIYVVARDKFALATLTDELQNEIDTYFTASGKAELQTYYKADEIETKICTDVVTCEARDNAFTSNGTTYEMEISDQNGDTVTTVLRAKVVLEDGTEQVQDKYNIIFKYENGSWKIDAFSK